MDIVTFFKNRWRSFFSIILSILIWEIVVHFDFLGEVFVSRPSTIFADGIELIMSGSLWPHFIISIEALSLGFFLALIVGTMAGLLIGYYNTIYDFVDIHLQLLSALPIVAITPLLIVWFGVGIASKIAIVFMMAIVPVLINTIDATMNTDNKFLKMARSFGACNGLIIRKIVFFNALPVIFSSAKIASGRAIVGLIIAEIFGYGKGLGYLVSFYASSFQTGKFMFILFILLLSNVLIVHGITFLERRTIFWNA